MIMSIGFNGIKCLFISRYANETAKSTQNTLLYKLMVAQ